MFWLRLFFIMFGTIHKRSGWRFPKLVATKVGLQCVQFSQLALKHRELELQLRIRELRLCYLASQLAQCQFDLRVSTCLRTFEKSLHSSYPIRELSCRCTHVPSCINDALEVIEIELHKYFLNKQKFEAELKRLNL